MAVPKKSWLKFESQIYLVNWTFLDLVGRKTKHVIKQGNERQNMKNGE